jgi:hypothetical protein
MRTRAISHAQHPSRGGYRAAVPELVFSDAEGGDGDTFEEGSDREFAELLEAVRTAAFRHPLAVQAAFSALVREGRRFAKTEEGVQMLDALLHSTSLSRLRVVWEVLTMSAFVERPDGAVPSVFIDTLVRGLKVNALEPLLARLLERRRP